MKKILIRVIPFLAIVILVLGLTNPNENRFLEKVAQDYGQFHGGMEIDEERLLKIGKSERSSYLIFSVYHYEFGNIGVAYFGIATNTIFVKSYQAETQQQGDAIVYAK
ncbi:MAG: hypothetical protein AAFX87_21060 [Bacteroidota bacterium]